MTIAITGDLDWTGALVLFLEALDGGPAADVAGYAFESSGDMEYSCSVPEPLLPENRLRGAYRCVAKTAGGILAGVGYVTIGAATTAVRILATAASSTWTDTEKSQIRYRLGLDGTATAPADPEVDPIVITPATGIMTTGYLVTRVKGVPTAGITIRYQQAQEPASDRGSSYDDTIYSAVSNSEGIAELSLVKGGLYYVWRSASTRPMNLASYRVLKADGSAPDATLALPSHVGA